MLPVTNVTNVTNDTNPNKSLRKNSYTKVTEVTEVTGNTDFITDFFSRGVKEKILISLINNKLSNIEISEETQTKSETIKVTINRNQDLFKPDKSSGITKYSLTLKANRIILNEYKTWLIVNTPTIQELSEDVTEKLLDNIKKYCNDYLIDQIVKSKFNSYQEIDVKKILEFDKSIVEKILDDPDEAKTFFEMGIQSTNLLKNSDDIKISFNNLPTECHKRIRDLRVKDINKLLFFEAVVREKSQVLPIIKLAKFECPSCGNQISITQYDRNKFIEPRHCRCGRKGGFNIVRKDIFDHQILLISDISDGLDINEEARQIKAVLQGENTFKKKDSSYGHGSKIRLTGVLKEQPLLINRVKTPVSNLYFEVHTLINIDDNFTDVQITDDDLSNIKKISNMKNPIKYLTKNIFNRVYGHDKSKEALLLQFFGGDRSNNSREKIHILLFGDPGVAKSELLDCVSRYAVKPRFSSGDGITGIGLIGTVIKDVDFGGWIGQPGVLSLANGGVAIIDEIDKANPDDLQKMHSAMEKGWVYLDKGNVHLSFKTDCGVLASANPIGGRFKDSSNNFLSQLGDFTQSLIDRFDLIIIFRDIPNSSVDSFVANKILNRKSDDESNISVDMFRKYQLFARKINPIISFDLKKKIVAFYVSLRSKSSYDKIITPRCIPSIIRFARIYARINLRDVVNEKDVASAIDIYLFGQGSIIDSFDVVEEMVFDKNYIVKDINERFKNKINELKIVDLLSDYDSEYHELVNDAVDLLKKNGDYYEPRSGVLMRT